MMRPQSEAELVEAIRSARGPLQIRGGGSRVVVPAPDLGAGAAAVPQIGPPVSVLHMAGLSGVSLYEPGALTLVAAAGTPLAEVEALLAGERQRLAFEPPDFRRLLGRMGVSTLGGMAATNASGPRRLQAGACRDAMLGLRFVTGEGDLVKNGGRVMKNVTGYDLVKLLAGAEGRLGVISEVSLRLGPCPETELSLSFGCTADPAAVMARALGSPLEVSGAALGPDGRIYLRLEGFEASVRARLRALEQLLAAPLAAQAAAPVVVHDAAASAELWRDIRDVAGFAAHPVVLRLSLRPSRLQDLRRSLAALAPDWSLMADCGGGLVWLAAPAAALSLATFAAQLEALRAWRAREGGHVSVVKLPPAWAGQLVLRQPEPPAVAALSAGLRHAFDPRGILNPDLTLSLAEAG